MPSVGNNSISQLTLTDYMVDKLNQNKDDLGIADVYFGDQSRLPRTPAVCVEPDSKDGELHGAQRKVQYTVVSYLLVYYDMVQDSIANRRGLLDLVDKVEYLFNADQWFGPDAQNGLIIHGYIARVESGYIAKGNTLMTAARMTHNATVQRILP